MKAVERDNMQSKINSLEAQLKASLELNTKHEATIVGMDKNIRCLRQIIAKRYSQGVNAGVAAAKKTNIWGANMDALKAECIRRTAAGEDVCVSSGKVILRKDLYVKKAA